jgi:prefoldin beta subunit
MVLSNEDYMEFNQYNSQLGALTNQKTQLKMISENIKQSLEEVEHSATTEIYKNLGNILVKTTKDKIKADLKSEMETISVRIKTIEKQEDLISKKLDSLKNKIEKESTKENKE